MEIDGSVPRIIHALRYSPGSPDIRAIPQLANGSVYDEGPDKGRTNVLSMMQRELAIAGVNGDFFPYTGDPLGAMVRSGELISSPFPNRPVFAWGPNSATTALLKWTGTVRTSSGLTLELKGLNQDCGNNDLVLNTEVAGMALAKSPCIYAMIEMKDPKWNPTSENTGTFKLFYTDIDAMPVQPGNVVLAARGKAMSSITKMRQGDAVSISLETAGVDWSKYEHAIGGGPFLLKNGNMLVDWAEQGFVSSFATKRHPRTAIGKTRDNDIWLVTVDGRQTISDGATLNELAQIMLRLGCTDAINLDGGGSTTFGLHGRVLNRPSDGSQRKIANGILFLGAPITPAEGDFAIKGPAKAACGVTTSYSVIGPDGKQVPEIEVVWSVAGPAWIDQGGTLRPVAAGEVTVSAFVRGKLLDLPVQTEIARS